MREKPIMARHQRMPPLEAGYTYAVEPTATNRLLANEEESIYGHSKFQIEGLKINESALYMPPVLGVSNLPK